MFNVIYQFITNVLSSITTRVLIYVIALFALIGCGVGDYNHQKYDLSTISDDLYQLSFVRLFSDNINKLNPNFAFIVCVKNDDFSIDQQSCVNAFKDQHGKDITFVEQQMVDFVSSFNNDDLSDDYFDGSLLNEFSSQAFSNNYFAYSLGSSQTPLPSSLAATSGVGASGFFGFLQFRNKKDKASAHHPFDDVLGNDIIDSAQKNAFAHPPQTSMPKSSAHSFLEPPLDQPTLSRLNQNLGTKATSVNEMYRMSLNEYQASVEDITNNYNETIRKILTNRPEGDTQRLLLKNININQDIEPVKLTYTNSIDSLLSEFDQKLNLIEKNYFQDSLITHNDKVLMDYLDLSKEAQITRLKYSFIKQRSKFQDGYAFTHQLSQLKNQVELTSKNAQISQEKWIDHMDSLKQQDINSVALTLKNKYDQFVRGKINVQLANRRYVAMMDGIKSGARKFAPWAIFLVFSAAIVSWVSSRLNQRDLIIHPANKPRYPDYTNSFSPGDDFIVVVDNLSKIIDSSSDYQTNSVVESTKQLALLLHNHFFKDSETKIQAYCMPRKIPGQVLSDPKNRAFCIAID